jgi:hypothetical protein
VDSTKHLSDNDEPASQSAEQSGTPDASSDASPDAPSDASLGESQQAQENYQEHPQPPRNPRTTTLIVGAVIIAAFGLLLVMANVFKAFAPPINPVIERSDELVKEGDQIQINILNGCGDQGVARRTMDFMRTTGFDVVEIENYSRFSVRQTFIIDRVGDTVSARKTARALGISDSLYVVRVDSTLYVRCSVVIGKDYRVLKPFQQ